MLFIGINFRYKGQVIGTVPDFEHFEARDQKQADEIAKSAGWDKAVEVIQKNRGAVQAPESANARLGLPRGKMSRVRIAFDVDGTLRCNCTDTCDDANERIVALFNILASFKNVQLFVWSGGGADYASRFAERFMLPVTKARCISKIGAPPMDIAIDDIQDTAIAAINLIVSEK